MFRVPWVLLVYPQLFGRAFGSSTVEACLLDGHTSYFEGP